MQNSREDICPEYEDSIQALVDGQMVGDERQRVENHIAGCRGCHAGLTEMLVLDQRLSRQIRQPALRAGFKKSLTARIEREAVLSAGAASNLRGSSALSWMIRCSAILDWINYGVFAVLVALGVAAMGGDALKLLPQLAKIPALPTPWMVLTLAASSGMFAAGCWMGLKEALGSRQDPMA